MPPVIQSWIDAQNAGDAAHAALYAPDAVFGDVPGGAAVEGPANAPLLAGMRQAFGEVGVEPLHVFATDDWAVVEYRFSAGNPGFPGTDPGRHFTVRATTVFELEGGKIRRSADYYDTGNLLRQLGAGVGPAARPPTGP